MAFRPVVPVIDTSNGSNKTDAASVKLRPFGSTVGQINCTHVGNGKYWADSAIDEKIAYHIYVDGEKRGMLFDDNVVPSKTTFAEDF